MSCCVTAATQTTHVAKLLVTASALRAYRNRQLSTARHGNPLNGVLMMLLSNAQSSTHSAKSLLASRVGTWRHEKKPSTTCFGRKLKKAALAACSRSKRAWCAKKPQFWLHPVTDEECRPLEDADESGTRLCSYWSGVFEAREGIFQDQSCRLFFIFCLSLTHHQSHLCTTLCFQPVAHFLIAEFVAQPISMS